MAVFQTDIETRMQKYDKTANVVIILKVTNHFSMWTIEEWMSRTELTPKKTTGLASKNIVEIEILVSKVVTFHICCGI